MSGEAHLISQLSWKEVRSEDAVSREYSRGEREGERAKARRAHMTIWSANTLLTSCIRLPPPPAAAPFNIGICLSSNLSHRPINGPIPAPNTANRNVRSGS